MRETKQISVYEGINEIELTSEERAERLDRFNAEVMDNLIQEINVNPHDCEHTPNHLLPLRIEANSSNTKQMLISKCTCCNAEVEEEYPLPYMDNTLMN